MKTRLNHVKLNVSNLEKAVEWYTHLLGFEENNSWPPEKPNYVDFIPQSGATFSLMEVEPIPCGGRYNFSVSDLDHLWKQLKDKVEVVEPLFETPYGTRKFTISDLDGNELGFVLG